MTRPLATADGHGAFNTVAQGRELPRGLPGTRKRWRRKRGPAPRGAVSDSESDTIGPVTRP